MPFDGKVSDYLETKPAPVYDRDNAPQTMWDAIRLGVRDLEAIERTPGYKIDMVWAHVPREDACYVCFAGAIMAQTLGVDRAVYETFDSFSSEWQRAFDLLDGLRSGSIRFHLFGDAREAQRIKHFTPYETDPAAFKRDMLALADRLEAEAV